MLLLLWWHSWMHGSAAFHDHPTVSLHELSGRRTLFPPFYSIPKVEKDLPFHSPYCWKNLKILFMRIYWKLEIMAGKCNTDYVIASVWELCLTELLLWSSELCPHTQWKLTAIPLLRQCSEISPALECNVGLAQRGERFLRYDWGLPPGLSFFCHKSDLFSRYLTVKHFIPFRRNSFLPIVIHIILWHQYF